MPGPRSPQNRYDVASGKNVAARRPTLIRSTPRQHCLVDHLTRASTPDNDADEAPGVPAGRRRLGHATASDAGLLPFKLRPPIHHTSCLHRGRPEEQIDRFRIRLNQFTESAVDTWKRIQRIRKKLESDFDTTVYEEMRWQTLKLDGGTVSNSEGAEVNDIEDTSEVRLVVFPRLYVVDDTKTVPVTTGVVLKSRSVKEHSERWMKRSRAALLLEDLWMREPGGRFSVALNGTTTQGKTFLG